MGHAAKGSRGVVRNRPCRPSLERGMERNWVRLRLDQRLRRNLEIRAAVMAGIRSFFAGEGFLEVDPPALVPLPGMEPHLIPFSTMVVDGRGQSLRFHLHTSPEYALKKLLTAGIERLYAMGHVFRNGEISPLHNPEFTLLEWYRTGTDYRSLMSDCEALLVHLAGGLGLGMQISYQGTPLDLRPPWPRISLGEAMRRHAGVDLEEIQDLEGLVSIAVSKGHSDVTTSWAWEDVFYKIFLTEVEPRLPTSVPFFLVDYPKEMAALARLKPGAPRWAERFELYLAGVELANGFSELTDAEEQAERLAKERDQRRGMGQEIYPVDASFLEALRMGMPEAAGIALGVDRLVMLLADAPSIEEVMAFPAEDLVREWRQSHEAFGD